MARSTKVPYDISPHLRAAWRGSRLTKTEVAARAGLSYCNLQAILQGRIPWVSAETIRCLAKAMHVSSDVLLGLCTDDKEDGEIS